MTWTAFRSHGREPFEPATEDWPIFSLQEHPPEHNPLPNITEEMWDDEDPSINNQVDEEIEKKHLKETKRAEDEAEHGDE